MVKAEDSQLSSCGFEPRRRILDGVSEASYYKWKNEIKVAKWGTPKKKKFNKRCSHKLHFLNLIINLLSLFYKQVRYLIS